MAEKRFIDEADLICDSFRLGVHIFNDGFRPTFLVGLWRGGSSVGIYVQECLQYLGVETDHIAVRTSYTGQPDYQQMVENPEENIRVHGTQYLLETLNAEDSLLLVDDVCSSGLTLRVVINRLKQRLKRNMPQQVKIATVWNKPGHNRTGQAPDYFLHETDDWLVLPYELSGLSMDEVRANKPVAASLIEKSGGRPT
ncbi:MAG: hypoxanthine phosphoribosyltransferase [Proteobacteria bacterium]|nr:hypoxanthine phosphoribosyltransferase [Pseudomonadota bacterium]